MPLAIPILCERALPPDRLNTSAGAASLASSSSAATANLAAAANELASTATSSLNTSNETNESKLDSLLRLGNECASLLDASCVSKSLSKSYKEESLRFTCQNGHNFFLAVDKLRQTLATLKANCITKASHLETLSKELLSSLAWCNKCAKYHAKVKNRVTRLGLHVTSGPFLRRIHLKCLRSNHTFSISHQKKLEQIACLQCRADDKESERQRQLAEERRRNEELSRQQERIFNEAKFAMQKEMLLNGNSHCGATAGFNANTSCNFTALCQCTSCCELRCASAARATTASQADILSNFEKQINSKANTMAKNFLANLSEAERTDEKLSFQKVFLAFKISETPENVLLEGLKLMGNSEQTKSYFKKLARLLHPDKNGHPLANQVFQKLQNATQLTLSSFTEQDNLRSKDNCRAHFGRSAASTNATSAHFTATI